MAEKKIGSRYFRAGEALATDAIKLQIRLMKIIGPALDKLPAVFAGRAAGASAEAQDASNAAAIQAISGIFEKADPDAFVVLLEDILALGKISYTGKGEWDDIVLDQEFSGANAKDLIPVALFILQETLGDFFTGLQASGALAKTARA
jgi:hypothetical protein